jgi:hypothetical protein
VLLIVDRQRLIEASPERERAAPSRKPPGSEDEPLAGERRLSILQKSPALSVGAVTTGKLDPLPRQGACDRRHAILEQAVAVDGGKGSRELLRRLDRPRGSSAVALEVRLRPIGEERGLRPLARPLPVALGGREQARVIQRRSGSAKPPHD